MESRAWVSVTSWVWRATPSLLPQAVGQKPETRACCRGAPSHLGWGDAAKGSCGKCGETARVRCRVVCPWQRFFPSPSRGFSITNSQPGPREAPCPGPALRPLGPLAHTPAFPDSQPDLAPTCSTCSGSSPRSHSRPVSADSGGFTSKVHSAPVLLTVLPPTPPSPQPPQPSPGLCIATPPPPHFNLRPPVFSPPWLGRNQSLIKSLACS